MDLHNKIKGFVEKWGPTSDNTDFVKDLRDVCNAYAESALVHGTIPEKGVPHNWKRADKKRSRLHRG